MGTRTIAGIVAVGVLGLLLAGLFRRDATSLSTTIAEQSNTASRSQATNDSRGRIVPLVVNDGFTGTAFIPSGDSNSSIDSAKAHRVLRSPTIRRNEAANETAASPQLDTHFPKQLRLLGIEDPSARDVNTEFEVATNATSTNPKTENERRPNGERIVYEVTRARAPIPMKHTIVDGDSLSSIARTYYGDESRAQEIFELNREHIPSFEVLPIGTAIELPSAQGAP